MNENNFKLNEYFNSGKQFLKLKLRPFINKNLRQAIGSGNKINLVLRKKYFPKDIYIQELYNEAFASMYSNLQNSCLSIVLILFEYSTKKIYKKIFGKKNDNWNNVLAELIKFYSKIAPNPIRKEILIQIQYYQQKVRNAQLHGNFIQLIENNTEFYHEGFNILCGDKKLFKLKYQDFIHGKKKDDIRYDVQLSISNYCFAIMNMFLLEFRNELSE